jgi:phospholipase C
VHSSSVSVLTKIIVLFSATILIFTFTGCGSGSASPDPPPQNQTPSVTFTASPTTITAGEFTTLNWSTTNVTSVSITPAINYDDDGTEVPLTGSKAMSPKETTTFTISATGPNGSATRSITVTVNQVAPKVTLTLNPTSILGGQSAELTWVTDGATSLNIDQGIGSVPLPSGSRTVTPTSTTTFTATAIGPGGTTTATATLTVVAAGQLAVTLIATPTTISPGQSSTLTWASQNASTVAIDQGVGAVNLSGSTTVSPGTTTTYTATATDPTGTSVTASAMVQVSASAGLNNLKHIVFFVQENRSFDNYFGKLGEYRQGKGLPHNIQAFDPDKALIDPAGHAVKPFHQRTVVTENLSPSWNESHYDLHPDGNGGFLMDRFLLTTASVPQIYDPHGTRAVGYYDQADIPYYYELATQFATSDSFHSSALSGTIVNRTFLFSATSAGMIRPANPFPRDLPTIFRLLENAGIKWKYYYQDNSIFLAYYGKDWDDLKGRVFPISDYFEILARPTADQEFPEVVFIEHAAELGLDEHPTNDIQKGVADAKKLIDALMKSTAWNSSVFILTHDEGGGLYDHVPPFAVPSPDGIAPMLEPDDLGEYDNFTLSGFRVPLIVVSPWVKKNYVSHVNREFTSILKLIETRFGLPSLTQRDAQSDDMTEFFDFSQPSWMVPPPMPDQPVECDTNPTRCDQRLEVEPNHPTS